MLGSTVNIYVSVGQALRQGSDETQGYRKTKHTYMISIQSHFVHIPGLPHREAATTHFEAVRDATTGDHGIVKYTSKEPPAIIGSILISDSAQASVDKVHKVLLHRLKGATEADDSYGGDEDEHRMRMFIHALQDHDLVVKFRIEEFMLWAHSYLMDRLNDEAPASVVYPRSHREYEKKTRTRSFGGRHSTPEKIRTGSSCGL